MKSQARAVVIGGGVVGVSTLYHLAKKGWNDSILLERKELTSGSTWHAAGLLPLFNMSYSVGQIHKYSVELYQRLGEEAGADIGLRMVSNIRLATNEDRMDEYRQYAGVAETIGVNVEFLTPQEVHALWPLCTTQGLVGAIRHPGDGYIQPADLTQALAAGARAAGAEIHRNTTVTGIARTTDGDWRVSTDKGDVICEHIVSCTGNFARQTGAMVGLEVPVIPVEHQYIVTEPVPKIVARHEEGAKEMGVLREPDGSWYMREENAGLLLGPYEVGAPACYVDGPDADSEYELFQGDIDRLMPHIESAINRVPAFAEVGIRQVYNGAIAYTPDGSPIIGPAWGVRNFWLNEGHSFGVTAAGGAGWQIAEWITEGEPTIDMLGVDPRRFGDYAGKPYLIAKNEETYANMFTIHYPDEERPAGRPLRTPPCHERLAERGAVFGQKFGWERANWFAPEGVAAEDHWSFRRSQWFEHVGAECRNVMENVGLLDMTAFAKARIEGPGAEAFLDSLVANKLPKRIGRVGLCHALNARGGVHSEFTIQREAEDRFYLVSAGAYQRLDHDWIFRHMPEDGSVRFANLTGQMGVLVVAGPKARTLMERVVKDNISNDGLAWLSGIETSIGLAPTKLLRVNFVGELGFELHHPMEYQNHIFDALEEAGSDLGFAPFGIRAMESMRVEKSYRMIGAELSVEYAAFESGLDRFVHPDKGDFVGREALLEWRERGFNNTFVTLELEDNSECDPLGSNPIRLDGKTVGRTTSGNYGFRCGKVLALGMVQPDLAEIGTALEVEVLKSPRAARVIANSPYDPDNARTRA